MTFFIVLLLSVALTKADNNDASAPPPVSEEFFSESSSFVSSHSTRAERPSPESVIVSLLISPFAKLGEVLGLTHEEHNLCQRELNDGVCAALYQGENCNGWRLEVPEGNLSFPYFSSYYKYRNAIQSVGVRVGCTLVGFDDSDFTGSKVTLLGESQWAPGQKDRYFWWTSKSGPRRCYHNPDTIYNLKNNKLNRDIEAVECHCQETSDFVCPWVNRDG